MKKVLLISMPYGALERPSLGLSLLKARLAEEGIGCDVRYLNFAFAGLVGHELYRWMSYELPYTAFAGDWSFTTSLYGERPEAERAYVREILRDTWRMPDQSVRRILHVRSLVEPFLEHCLAAVPWDDYAVAGFTSTFEQNVASLSLARRVKAARPDLSVVFGGANWEDTMGVELHRRFPFVDYVCSGESERSFPELARRLLAGRARAGAGIPGVVHRDARGRTVSGGPPETVREMDSLPYPDFSDFFRELGRSPASSAVLPTLLFETSRGCWWGARKHCTFCGLNGGSMAFRSKSPRRALDELEHLVDRWRTEQVEAVDNILDMKYFDDMLPALASSGRAVRLFYEVKANLTREQVRLLSEAGVERIQPGIESLSDHVLRLMRKGTTGLRNVQLLKWAQEYGVAVEWNILYGFPGETAEDYRRVLAMLPALRFLRPPYATGPVRLDRFSPYHADPAGFGLKNVRPLPAYRHLYPFGEESLARIAYYFEFDYEPGVNPAGHAAAVVAYANDWKRNPERGTLYAVEGGAGALTLYDTRAGATVPELKLTGLERAAYEYCDEAHPGPKVVAHLRRSFPEASFEDRGVYAFLDSLVANRLMVTDGESYLSLALRARPPAPGRPAGEAARPTRPASSYLRRELRVLTA